MAGDSATRRCHGCSTYINRGQSGYLALYHWDRPHHTVRVLRIHHQREAGYADDEV